MNKFLKGTLCAMMGTAAALSFTACSDDDTVSTQQVDEEVKTITEQYLDHTVNPTYTLLANGTQELYEKLAAMRDKKLAGQDVTQEEMNVAAEVFLEARANYELSEAFLFGAASDFGIDPHIDSWPLDLNAMKTALLNTAMIEALKTDDGSYAGTALQPAVLGFHGIEYVLFRNGAVRTDINGIDAGLNDLTGTQELIYAAAVAGDLRNSCFRMEVAWNADADPSHVDLVEGLDVPFTLQNGMSYSENMRNAAAAGSTYKTWSAVLNDIIIAGCENIVNEVGDIKMGKPFGSSSEGEDPDYIESPYSKMSKEDFKHNIESVENAIMGGRKDQRDETKSVYAYINKRNAEMATTLKAKIQTAYDAIDAIPGAFVDNKKDPKVGEAIEACKNLDNYLKDVDKYIRENY